MPDIVPAQELPPSKGKGLKGKLIRFLLHFLVDLYLGLYRIGALLHRTIPRLKPDQKRCVLLTGTFHSRNWIMNHLGPMALSGQCRKIWIVCSFPIPETKKVIWICPPKWMRSLLGETPARLLIYSYVAVRHRPEIIGGFHLLINGLQAMALARFLGRKSLYINGGGPRETVGGGYLGNKMFGGLGKADAALERKLLKAVNQIDIVVTMGRKVIEYLRKEGATHPRFEVVPGGIDGSLYESRNIEKKYDLITVGRMGYVKRFDILLESIKEASKRMPSIALAIVGDGELEEELKDQAARLGISGNVSFPGFQTNVVSWLHQSRVFVLTSDSEGLSLALMEAMMCGLPAIVSDVGELSELIKDDENGFLVERRQPGQFAQKFVELLGNNPKLAAFSHAAKQAASRFEIGHTAERWNAIFSAS